MSTLLPPLYEFQRHGRDKLLTTKRGGMLAMEPGLGKTRTAISYATLRGYTRVLVLAPVNALGVWQNELEKLTDYEVFAPTGTRTEKASLIPKLSEGWLLLNYEALVKPPNTRKWVMGDAISTWKPQLLILDESQKIKNPTAKRSKAAHNVGAVCEDVLLLTGTPISHNILDLYSQYKAVDPGVWRDKYSGKVPSWSVWRREHAIFGGFEGREVVGHTDAQVKDIKNRIQKMIYVMTKDRALDLPDTTDQIVPVPVDIKQYYKAAEMETNPLTKALRLQQYVSDVKVPYTVDLINDLLEAEQKVVVFFRFINPMLHIDKALGSRAYVIYGKIKAAERRWAIETWKASKEPSAMLLQISAGSTAIDLSASSNLIFHGLTWSHDEHKQARDRVHRHGQRFPVTYRYMVGTGGGRPLIDDLILDALENKRSFEQMIMADPSLLGR